MVGFNLSMKQVVVTLRNPLNKQDKLDYTINVYDHEMAQRWFTSLQDILRHNNYLEKNFCFLGFPNSSRDLAYICKELNWAVQTINNYFVGKYQIKEQYLPEALRDKNLKPNQEIMNALHNHFEILQGTVWGLSEYYKRADYTTKFAIRQLNNLCHEAESLMLSQRKQATAPEWIRPSQITTFLNCQRINFPDYCKTTFNENRFNRRFGEVYLHWTQIGKTLFEVYRDENGVDIDKATCDAITHLRYYSGEFDIEWAKDITFTGENPWHIRDIKGFKEWLVRNDFDLNNTEYNFGHHPVGQVNLMQTFGSDKFQDVLPIISNYLDIYEITAGEVSACYDYAWSDSNYYEQQIERLKPGYDYSSRR